MKTLRYVILLTLAAALLAGCGALPPLMPNAAGPTAAVAPTEAAPELAPTEVAAQPVATEAAAAAPAATAPAEQAATTPAATEAATAAPEAQTTPVVEPPAGDNPLVGTVWEWAALIKTQPAMQSVVPDPSSYAVTFTGDGQMQIKADCNNAQATYTLENDALAVTLGAVTRAACPPGSLSADFLTHLSAVAAFEMDGSDLILRLADDGGSMIFRNGGPVAEAAPPAVATEAPAGAPADAETPQLVGTTWQWENFFDVATGKNSFDIANPASYTLTFLADGTVAMQADCNRAAGTYTVEGAALRVEVGPVTLAACGAESRGADFLINLTAAGTYMFIEGKLAIDLQADSGRMVFGAAK